MNRVALVLAGGAARGAYEVGVLEHLANEVARDLGRELPIEILCGTSVGAINACFMAAFADQPRARVAKLRESWVKLAIGDVVKLDPVGVARLFQRIVPGARFLPASDRGGGLIDPRGLERIVTEGIPFHRIDEHIRSGQLHALTISTTQLTTGRTVVFVSAREKVMRWAGDATTAVENVSIRVQHALASAAIPILFPSVRLGNHYYADGGLRQNVPLSPARRLGAEGLIVINPRYLPPTPRKPTEPDPPPNLLTLLGKGLNALLLDRVDADLDRLSRINGILAAGRRSFGDRFLDEVNRELRSPVRELHAVMVRASADIGRMAAVFVRSREFERRAPWLVEHVMRALATDEPRGEADLLSYLLFDGEFAEQLIELGRRDARAQHEALCAFFERPPEVASG